MNQLRKEQLYAEIYRNVFKATQNCLCGFDAEAMVREKICEEEIGLIDAILKN